MVVEAHPADADAWSPAVDGPPRLGGDVVAAIRDLDSFEAFGTDGSSAR